MANLWKWMMTYISRRCGALRARPLVSARETALMLGEPAGLEEGRPAGWRVLPASSLEEAQVLLAREEISVVLYERDAPGVDWQRAIRLLAASPCQPSVVLLARPGRQPRWDEVAAAGGYDLLPEPVSAGALERTMRSAQSHWRSRRALESASRSAAPM